MATGRLDGIEIRRATHGDDPQVLELMAETHGWRPDEPNEALFGWKHRENPLGESPAWVALDGEQVVGFRTFMRWEFLAKDNQVVSAVRAVDTATAEGFRGRGIFQALTLQAVGELTLEGVGIVFNTPNDQSLGGYLKMGWTSRGRIPIGVMPSGPSGLRRMAAAKVPAARWSEPCAMGIDAALALADPAVSEALLAHAPGSGFRTHRTAESLAWRTALARMHYRLQLVDPDDPGRGGIIFRLRRRGNALEIVLLEVLVARIRQALTLTRGLLRETGADYALAVRSGASAGFAPLPRQGPLLTSRPLAATPPRSGWSLTMADVELM